MKVGVVGLGVVGKALYQVANDHHYVLGYDVKTNSADFLGYLISTCEILFLCLPTPTTDQGQDTSALVDVLSEIERIGFDGTVAIKSTVLPGTCVKLQIKFNSLKIAHNPEFLTEKNAFLDFKNEKNILISSFHLSCIWDLNKFYQAIFNSEAVIYESNQYEVTELAKYLHNCFLATKVAFMNEFFNVCSKYGADYELIRQMACSQGKIGSNHTQVPGPNHKFGFGGSCFPKDTEAFLKNREEELTILDAAVKSNKKVRQ